MKNQFKIIWGFMLENAYFVEFDIQNHIIIETAFQQKKLKQASHYIMIHDSHLPCPAKIYFGVIRIHLRMPGTRYYVKRKTIPVQTQQSYLYQEKRKKKSPLFLSPSASTSTSTSTSSFNTTITPIPSTPIPMATSNTFTNTMTDKLYDTINPSFIDINNDSYSWLDSIYTAMPLFTNVQALLIPWSTSPSPSPPPSSSSS
ncbi:unnamed protein product [Cunninghamella echinulata]